MTMVIIIITIIIPILSTPASAWVCGCVCVHVCVSVCFKREHARVVYCRACARACASEACQCHVTRPGRYSTDPPGRRNLLLSLAWSLDMTSRHRRPFVLCQQLRTDLWCAGATFSTCKTTRKTTPNIKALLS